MMIEGFCITPQPQMGLHYVPMTSNAGHNSRRRVVITGLGPITAFGMGVEPLWSAMCEGRSALKRISRFDPSGFPCQIAGELSDELFDVKSVVPKSYRKATKVMARDIELAVGAAAAAVADAKLITKAVNPETTPTIPPERFGCHIGAGLIAADLDELTAALVTSRVAIDDLRLTMDESGQHSTRSFDDASSTGESARTVVAAGVLNRPSAIDHRQSAFDLSHWGHTGMQNLTPLWLLKYLPNMLACHVTIIHDCQGPSNTITCAETSAMLSVGESMRAIQRGSADACLSGGAESKINPMGLLRQTYAGRLAETNGSNDASMVVKPFDRESSGGALGEGGGIVVLEELESAKKRGANVYAEITGFAATQSYCPDTVGLMIEENGESIADAIEAALSAARIGADQIDAIAPLGSGIRHIDQAEIAAIKKIFGSRASQIPLITAIPNVGNCGAGASAVSLILACMAMKTQTLPARSNTNRPDGLNAAACKSQPAKLNHLLITCTGMGGQNAAIVLKKP